MSKKMQIKALGACFIALSTAGFVFLAVGLDRADVYTQFDQTIYFGTTVLVYVVSKALMRLTRSAAR